MLERSPAPRRAYICSPPSAVVAQPGEPNHDFGPGRGSYPQVPGTTLCPDPKPPRLCCTAPCISRIMGRRRKSMPSSEIVAAAARRRWRRGTCPAPVSPSQRPRHTAREYCSGSMRIRFAIAPCRPGRTNRAEPTTRPAATRMAGTLPHRGPTTATVACRNSLKSKNNRHVCRTMPWGTSITIRNRNTGTNVITVGRPTSSPQTSRPSDCADDRRHRGDHAYLDPSQLRMG